MKTARLRPRRRVFREILLLGVLLLGFAVRTHRLGAPSLWLDELRTMEWVRWFGQLNPEGLFRLVQVDFQPPLYFLLLHLWTRFVGETEFALRYLSVIFAVLALAVLYRLGKTLGDYRVGALAALLGAASPLLIHWAQELRPYSLAAFLVAASFWAMWRLAESQSRATWAAYVLTTVASIYTHYVAFLPLLAQNLIAIVIWRSESRADRTAFGKRWLAAQGSVLLLFAPWLAVPLNSASVHRLEVPEYSFPFLSTLFWQSFNLDWIQPTEQVAPVLWALSAGVFISIALAVVVSLRDRTSLLHLGAVALWFLVPALTWTAITRSRVPFNPRYLVIMTPGYVLLLAFLVGRARRWSRVLGLSLGMGLLGAFAYGSQAYFAEFSKEDARGLGSFLGENTGRSDAIIVALKNYPSPGYYYRGAAPLLSVSTDASSTPTMLSALLQDRQRLFTVHSVFVSTDPLELLTFLSRKYGSHLGQQIFAGYTVNWYRIPPNPDFRIAAYWEPAGVRFGEELELVESAYGGTANRDWSTEAEVNQRQVAPDRIVWVALRWRLHQKTEVDYGASLILGDAQGHQLAQIDRELLAEGRLPTSEWHAGQTGLTLHWMAVPVATPPGTHELNAVLYQPETLAALGAYTSEGTFLGSRVKIGEIEVLPAPEPPSLDRLEIQNPLHLGFGELDLLGHDIVAGPFLAGDLVPVALYWKADEQPVGDYAINLELRDADGAAWGSLTTRPVHGTYATTRWQAGELLRDWYDLRVAPDAPPGDKTLVLKVVDVPTGTELGEFALATLRIEAPERRFTAPVPANPLDWRFGEQIRLVGYDLDHATLQPGEDLSLILYWQALAPMDTPFTVFTHVLGSSSQIWGQLDQPPRGGAHPTTAWVPGEYVEDPYVIGVDPQAPPGQYVIEVGFYDAATGRRLQVADAAGRSPGDRVLLPTTLRVGP